MGHPIFERLRALRPENGSRPETRSPAVSGGTGGALSGVTEGALPIPGKAIGAMGAVGRADGHEDGHEDGHKDGHADGHADGHEEGHAGGRILLLPGSRAQEITTHLPIMLDALDLIRQVAIVCSGKDWPV